MFRGLATVNFCADDPQGTVGRLLAMGATEYQPITEHDDGSGNVLGVMHNPHYLEIVGKRS